MKTKIIILLLLITLPISAVSTTFSSNGIKISDYNFSLDFDSLTFSYKKNGFQVGKISLFSLSELIYPFDYIWEEKVERNRTNNLSGISYNSELTNELISKYCILGVKEKSILEKAFEKYDMSARMYYKILKIARTIADVDGNENISCENIMEAICYRTLDKKYCKSLI